MKKENFANMNTTIIRKIVLLAVLILTVMHVLTSNLGGERNLSKIMKQTKGNEYERNQIETVPVLWW